MSLNRTPRGSERSLQGRTRPEGNRKTSHSLHGENPQRCIQRGQKISRVRMNSSKQGSWVSPSLLVLVRIKALNTITSSRLKRISKLVVQLRSNTPTPVLQHLVSQTNIRPVVPTNKRSLEERTSRVLRVGLVIVVGETVAVGSGAVLVINKKRRASVAGELVACTVVFAVAGGSYADDIVTLGENDDVLPVVAVTTEKAATNSLILLKVGLIPWRTNISMYTRLKRRSPRIRGLRGKAYMMAQKPLLQRLRE
jgi:hypothetical protein